jgi:hypothetical protein
MAFFDSFGDTEVCEFDPPLVWRVCFNKDILYIRFSEFSSSALEK